VYLLKLPKSSARVDTVRVFRDGNFVFALSEGSFAGAHTAFYDLFRVQGGNIAEHWDTIETILPKEQWKNETGKF
jgi:predicted SnoaL-like aldol condensation-catalyzing enzyme